jgi:predicted metalloprotease with PDZ domain
VDGTEPERKSYLGIIVKGNGGRYIVDSVLEGSPAFEAGLNPKDEIVAINGFRFGDRFLKDLREDFKKLRLDNLADYEPDSKVRINFFRRGILMDVELTLSSAPYEYYEVLDDPQPNNGSENLKSKFLVT